MAESITLELPPWHTVLQVLEKEGIDAQGWPEDARELLRYPQALNTLLQLKQGGEAEVFRNYPAMLERLSAEQIFAQATQHRESAACNGYCGGDERRGNAVARSGAV